MSSNTFSESSATACSNYFSSVGGIYWLDLKDCPYGWLTFEELISSGFYDCQSRRVPAWNIFWGTVYNGERSLGGSGGAHTGDQEPVKCVILQPSYIPWRGYFHQIWKADCFIFYDDVQYDARGWRNRNHIKTPQGPKWLTIPVYRKGARREGRLVKDVRICPDTPWQDKHRRALEFSYGRAPFFSAYMARFESFYEERWELLSDLTIEMTMAVASELGVPRKRFLRSSTLKAGGSKTDRLLDLLKTVGATHYITGPSARSYLEEEKFWNAGISLEYMNYDYAEYAQLYPPYDGQVSILDLLFMTGRAAMQYILTPSKSVSTTSMLFHPPYHNRTSPKITFKMSCKLTIPISRWSGPSTIARRWPLRCIRFNAASSGICDCTYSAGFT